MAQLNLAVPAQGDFRPVRRDRLRRLRPRGEGGEARARRLPRRRQEALRRPRALPRPRGRAQRGGGRGGGRHAGMAMFNLE